MQKIHLSSVLTDSEISYCQPKNMKQQPLNGIILDFAQTNIYIVFSLFGRAFQRVLVLDFKSGPKDAEMKRSTAESNKRQAAFLKKSLTSTV